MSSANEGNTHFLISRLHSLPQSATFFLSAAHPSDYSLCLAHGSIALSLHTSDLLRCSSAPSLVAPLFSYLRPWIPPISRICGQTITKKGLFPDLQNIALRLRSTGPYLERTFDPKNSPHAHLAFIGHNVVVVRWRRSPKAEGCAQKRDLDATGTA